MNDRPREALEHLDGTRIFSRPEDHAASREVADRFAKALGCELHPFGALSPIDWYATRHERLVGLMEVKCRSHDRGTYPTVFLSVRKWLALSLGSVGMGVPGIFAVRFNDGICWISVANVDASAHRMGGWSRPAARADVEPVIEVPVAQMRVLEEKRDARKTCQPEKAEKGQESAKSTPLL